MFQFGIGGMYANPTGGNLATPSGPAFFGTIQNIDLDIDGKNVELRGQNQFPDDVAPSDKSIKGKAGFAKIEIDIYNSLFYGETITTGMKIVADREADTVPGGSGLSAWQAAHVYTLGQVVTDGTNAQKVVTAGTSETPGPPAWNTNLGGYTSDGTVVWQNLGPVGNTLSVTNVADFLTDLGVMYALTGKPFMYVAGAPAAAGEYTQAGGVYTFHASDAAAAVLISYVYSSLTGRTLLVTNRIQGYGPTFELYLMQPYQGTNGLHLFACRASKMSNPLKRDGYLISDFEFTGYANAAGQVSEFFQISS
jgi:hypothetical protein